MSKHHAGKQFMLGAMLGSTIGAISAMMFTTKKGHSLHKTAMKKMHEFEGHVKRFVHSKKNKVTKTIKSLQKTVKRKKSRKAR